jgi:hypothetical protein
MLFPCLIKRHAMKTHGGVEVQLPIFIILALGESEWAVLHPKDYAFIHCFVWVQSLVFRPIIITS